MLGLSQHEDLCGPAGNTGGIIMVILGGLGMSFQLCLCCWVLFPVCSHFASLDYDVE
jgi:hypothetical protein